MEIRAATREDLNELGVETFGNTMRAITVHDGSRVVGIAGVLHSQPLQCFSEIHGTLRDSPRSIVRTAKRLRNLLNTYDATVYAVASSEEKNPDKFLKFVGFTFLETNSTGSIYQWQQQHPTS